MACAFFYVKIFMQFTFIYTINLLKYYLFQSPNYTGYSVGFRHAMKKYIRI